MEGKVQRRRVTQNTLFNLSSPRSFRAGRKREIQDGKQIRGFLMAERFRFLFYFNDIAKKQTVVYNLVYKLQSVENHSLKLQ